jgi:ATP-dependent DNA helicase RecG
LETNPETGLEPPENTKETPKKHTRNTKELVLKALKAQPDVTAKALALALKLSEASVRHHLRVLQAAQRIRHVGPTKGGHWEVLDT